MAAAKLSDVKNDLSRYVARARRGERIRILIRGVAVAEIGPLEAALEGEGEENSRLAELERRGLIRRGRGGLEPGVLKPGPRPRGRPTSDLLIEERRSGR
jgi:antitoxin (DNA-binding transcriptional repressor) of toxin-antitoxin stability system